jgi:Zinc finger, C3HC4 type (RING finger)
MFSAFTAGNNAAALSDVYGDQQSVSINDIFDILETAVRFRPDDANIEVSIDDDLDIDIKLLEDVKLSIATKLRETHLQLKHTHDLLEEQEKINEKAREFFQLKHDSGDVLFDTLVNNARIYNANVVQKHGELRDEYAQQCARAHVLLDRLNMTRISDDYTCCICMENPVDTAIVPCGHTLCSMCIARTSLGMRACHRCKAPVETCMRLFF